MNKRTESDHDVMCVSGCQASGVYGHYCTEPCPTNCKNSVCHIQKGTCFGCVSGWMNTTCDTSRIKIEIDLLCF